MKSRSHQFDEVEAPESWLASVATGDFRPTLAIVFMGIRHDRLRVQQAFARHGISVFGSSSWGEFTVGDIRDGTIAVLLMDMARDRFELQVDDFELGDERKVTSRVVQAARERFDRPSFMILTADLRTNGEAIVRSFGKTEATVYFTCVGRHNSLGPGLNREIRQAAKQVGSSMVGLLSSGEMARATGGRLEFNSLTSCCVLLREVEA